MKILVTGATGLVGNNVVRALLSRGVAVKVLVREGADPRPLAGLDVEPCRGDVRDRRAVQAACAGASHVVHAAAKVGIGGRGLEVFRAINVEGTRHAAAGALRHGARLVHVSTADTIGCRSMDRPGDETAAFDRRFATPYSLSKWEAESVVAEAVARGLDAVIVNPSFMLGPWDWKPSSGRMLLAVARGLGAFPPRGTGNFVDARDVARGIVSAAESGRAGERYLLTGQMLSWLDAWRLFAEVTGGRPPVWRIGPVVSWISGWTGDLIGLSSGGEPAVNSAALRAARAPANFSCRRAEEELGFCRSPLRKTVEEAWEWFRANGYSR